MYDRHDSLQCTSPSQAEHPHLSSMLICTMCVCSCLQGNPCCEEPDHRLLLIYAMPSLQVLDHHQVRLSNNRCYLYLMQFVTANALVKLLLNKITRAAGCYPAFDSIKGRVTACRQCLCDNSLAATVCSNNRCTWGCVPAVCAGDSSGAPASGSADWP
jgi:hypothetical protein